MKKGVLILGLGRGLQMLLLFLNYRLLTTVLSKQEVGEYFFILSLTAVTGLIFINPLGTYFNRTLHSLEGPAQVRKHMLIVFSVICGLSLFNIPLVGVIKNFFISISENWILVAGVISFYVASTSANNTLVPVFNFFKKRNTFVILTVGTQGLALLFAYYLGVKSGEATSWLLGHAFGFSFFVMLVFFLKIPFRGAAVPTSSASMPLISIQAWQFALPVGVVNVVVWGLTQGYRPFLEKFAGLEMLAEIGLGLGLASSLAVAFEYLVQQVYQPDFYEKANEDSTLAWKNLAFKSFIHYFGFCVFLFSIANFALPLLAEGSYELAKTFLRIGAFIEGLRMTSNLMALKAHGDLNTSRLRLPYLAAAGALVVGLSILPFLKSGLSIGIVCVLLLSYSVLIVLIVKVGQISLRDFWHLGTREKKLFLSFLIFPTAFFLPGEWSHHLLSCIVVCGVYGLLFLWMQYKVVLRFEHQKAVQ